MQLGWPKTDYCPASVFLVPAPLNGTTRVPQLKYCLLSYIYFEKKYVDDFMSSLLDQDLNSFTIN